MNLIFEQKAHPRLGYFRPFFKQLVSHGMNSLALRLVPARPVGLWVGNGLVSEAEGIG